MRDRAQRLAVELYHFPFFIVKRQVSQTVSDFYQSRKAFYQKAFTFGLARAASSFSSVSRWDASVRSMAKTPRRDRQASVPAPASGPSGGNQQTSVKVAEKREFFSASGLRCLRAPCPKAAPVFIAIFLRNSPVFTYVRRSRSCIPSVHTFYFFLCTFRMVFFFPLPLLFPPTAPPNPPAFRPFSFTPVCLCPVIPPTAGLLASFARLAAAGFAVWLP